MIERLAARTTADPTNLEAPLDVEHFDRLALVHSFRIAVQCCGRGQPAAARYWCPMCGWATSDSGDGSAVLDMEALLDHAADAAAPRSSRTASSANLLAHRRVLVLLAELLLRQPPERSRLCQVGGAARQAKRCETTRHAVEFASPTISAELQRLLHALAVGSKSEYESIEQDTLGLPEDDIFG